MNRCVYLQESPTSHILEVHTPVNMLGYKICLVASTPFLEFLQLHFFNSVIIVADAYLRHFPNHMQCLVKAISMTLIYVHPCGAGGGRGGWQGQDSKRHGGRVQEETG
jgi:hypothetical protein